MRVVLDTNVLISALLGSRRQPPSPPARILAAWRAGRFEVVTSVAQLDEIKRVLSYQKIRARLNEALANALIEDFFNVALVMAVVPEVLASPDPDDDMLLAIAQVSDADYLVSGDKVGLLSLVQFGRTMIVTVRDFMELLEG